LLLLLLSLIKNTDATLLISCLLKARNASVRVVIVCSPVECCWTCCGGSYRETASSGMRNRRRKIEL